MSALTDEENIVNCCDRDPVSPRVSLNPPEPRWTEMDITNTLFARGHLTCTLKQTINIVKSGEDECLIEEHTPSHT